LNSRIDIIKNVVLLPAPATPRRDTPRAHWCQFNVKPIHRLLFDY